MKIHEFQAKKIFSEYKIPIPRGEVAKTPEEAKAIAEKLGGTVVVKAQIHAGGRGKGGGVKVAKNAEEAYQAAQAIIGMNLVTHQTGPQGTKVKQVLIEEGLAVEKELYLGVVIDRAQAAPVIMASEAGGMEIEEVAAKTPEKILKVAVDPATGFTAYHARKLAYGLNLNADLIKKAVPFIASLYKIFIDKDCSLIEINPLVITKDGTLLALDAKMNFDDDGLFRHPEIKELYDVAEQEPLEVEAGKYKLNYIKLDGNVGCMVNGAGLAMATMDIIKIAGGEPANFLDVGGGASAEQVENAFRILLSDKNVKVVLINIFGGILRCDRVATGIVEAAKRIEMKLPMVVRLEGTNVEEGRRILKESGLKFEVATTFEDAAQKVSRLAKA
jgi:succinyl-CoA synthetase beta subunit